MLSASHILSSKVGIIILLLLHMGKWKYCEVNLLTVKQLLSGGG